MPSLRARDCDKNEKDALNYAFLVRAAAPPATSVACGLRTHGRCVARPLFPAGLEWQLLSMCDALCAYHLLCVLSTRTPT